MIDARPESAIQRDVVNYLTNVLPKSHRAFAVPNAAPRRKGGKASNGVAGLRAGVPDLVIVGLGRVYFLEVKSARGKLSDAQSEWGSWCVTKGLLPWACVHSVDETRAALAHWNVETREAKQP